MRTADSELSEREKGKQMWNNGRTARKRLRSGEQHGSGEQQQKGYNELSSDTGTQLEEAVSAQLHSPSLSDHPSYICQADGAADFPSTAHSHADEHETITRQRFFWSTSDASDTMDNDRQYSDYTSPSPAADSLRLSPFPLTFMSSAACTSVQLHKHSVPHIERWRNSPTPLPLPLPLSSSSEQPVSESWSNPIAAADHSSLLLSLPCRPAHPSQPRSPLSLSTTALSYTHSVALSDPTRTQPVVEEVGGQLRSFLISLYLRYGMRHPVFEQSVVSPALIAEAIAAARQMQCQRLGINASERSDQPAADCSSDVYQNRSES